MVFWGPGAFFKVACWSAVATILIFPRLSIAVRTALASLDVRFGLALRTRTYAAFALKSQRPMTLIGSYLGDFPVCRKVSKSLRSGMSVDQTDWTRSGF